MTNRFYTPNLNTDKQNIILDDPKIVHQIKNVLRLKPGEIIFLFTQTQDIELEILKIQDKSINVKKIKSTKKNTQPHLNVTLYQSLLKKDNFEWIVQKTTEIGVSKIVPIITQHTIVRKISDNKKKRYTKIAIEATEQCGGEKPPEIYPATSFDDALKNIKKQSGIKMMPWEGEKIKHISSISSRKDTEHHLIIGPEGGFSPIEVQMAKNSGVKTVSMGNRILRAETAAIAAISLIMLNDQ